MAESPTSTETGPHVGLEAADWCIGIFGPSGTRLPAQCLRRCLHGDPAMAGMLGCTLLKALVRRAGGEGATEPFPAAPTCTKGLAASVDVPDESGAPDVLVLRPASQARVDLAPAIELVRKTAGELWRLEQENTGLADEVLRNYEQINLIFDVSAQIAILNDANEVKRMLLMKLRYLFDADSVFYLSPDLRMVRQVTRDGGIRRGWARGDAVGADPCFEADRTPEDPRAVIELPKEFASVVQKLRQARRVLVSSDDDAYQQSGHGTSMWGPLSDGDDEISIVGIVRRDKTFVAGDMLVLDSALTFASHILSNLRLVEQLKRTSFEAVRALVNAIDQKDNYTCGHSERVGFLARVVGEHMGLAPEVQQELEWAGLLHDVGKIGIPERVLNKPGSLTPEEYAIIRGHPQRSYEVLRPVASLQVVLEAVLHHHENPDGSGYPAGLSGDQIPLAARIIHVVDVFDALTSTRSYRRAFDAARAIGILKDDAGTKLDARIVEEFLGAWDLLPKTHPQQYEQWFAAIQAGAMPPGGAADAERAQQPASGGRPAEGSKG